VASRQSPGSLATAKAVHVTVSLAAPTVSIAASSVSGYITETLALRITARPASSQAPLTSVLVSLDGGYEWRPATADITTNSIWNLTWNPPLSTDASHRYILVRARDVAGNTSTAAHSIAIDNWGPTPFDPVTLTPDVGTHLQASGQVKITWTPARDGSGTVTMLAAASQAPDTIPLTTQTVSGTSYTAQFNSAGTWYIHVAAVDAAGNLTVRHYGPWYVETGG
jgi:hypothetical protein